MSPRRVCTLFVALMALLAGCQDINGPSSDQLAASVAEMTRTDVTRPDAAGTQPPVVNRTQGYQGSLRAAIVQNPQFIAAIRHYNELGAGVVIAKSALRPQVGVSATLGGLAGGDEEDVTFGGAADVSLSQMIFDGGATRATISGATAEAYAARADIDVSGNQVGRNAARAWIDLWQVSAQLALLTNRMRDIEPMIERIERLITNGIVDRASLAAAQRQFLDLKLDEEDLLAQFRDAQERFNRYYGTRPTSVTAPQRLFSEAELTRMTQIWSEAPTLIAAAANLIAAEQAVDFARAQNRPTVSLRAGARSPLEEAENPDLNVGFVVRYELSDGGRRAAEITRLDERLEAGRASFENTKSSVRVETETALSNYRSMRDTIGVLEAQISQLDIERSTLGSQISSGQANFSQLVEAEVLSYRAQTRLLEIHGELATLEVTLAAVTGQLTRKLNITPDQKT